MSQKTQQFLDFSFDAELIFNFLIMLACWLFAFNLLLPWIPYCVDLEDYIVQSPYDDPRYQLLGIIMKGKNLVSCRCYQSCYFDVVTW